MRQSVQVVGKENGTNFAMFSSENQGEYKKMCLIAQALGETPSVPSTSKGGRALAKISLSEIETFGVYDVPNENLLVILINMVKTSADYELYKKVISAFTENNMTLGIRPDFWLSQNADLSLG